MLQEQLEALIRSAEQGEAGSRERLFAALYGELHRLAQRELRRSPLLTLSPTTLLHETYLNLSSRQSGSFPDRARFLAYASRAMRGLLIDYLRSRRAQKRGAAFEITSLPTETPDGAAVDEQLEGIGEALELLGTDEPRLAQIVDLKYFCGFSFAEIAGVLGVSERTVQRDWDKARILLRRYLEANGCTPIADGAGRG
ncbi:MAG TPA: ECF-type sigma factor [Steroidobacteraceae bacterium]|jgi:RNA polymerase sigma factor (TIGR02999 family)|nr:ECF-type sigma factor [Steroidobacteraceae bacterium]